MGATTQWEKVSVSTATAVYLRGTHELWSRLCDGEHRFVVIPNGQKPVPAHIGCSNIASALDAKGMLTWKAEEL